MPISRKRKKKGKKVKHEHRLERFDDMESGVTLQDLINVVAAQEYQKDKKDGTTDISDLPGENWVEDDMNDQSEENQDER